MNEKETIKKLKNNIKELKKSHKKRVNELVLRMNKDGDQHSDFRKKQINLLSNKIENLSNSEEKFIKSREKLYREIWDVYINNLLDVI